MQVITQYEAQCIHDALSHASAEGLDLEMTDAMEIITAILSRYHEEGDRNVEEWLEDNERKLAGGR